MNRIFEILELEITLLSKIPNSVQRQSALNDYSRILDFWHSVRESEPTSYSETELRLRKLLSDLGAESLF